MKNNIYVEADKYAISVLTNCVDAIVFLKNNIDKFSRLTITFNLPVDENAKKTDAKIIYNDCDRYCLRFDKETNELYLECPWNMIDNSTFFPMIFRYIVEWLRQCNNEIKVHASSVSFGNKTALFFAPSEGGKTTTAMALCQKFRCLLRSNDASVLKIIDDVPQMLRGDTFLNVRYNGLEAYSKTIYKDKVNKINNENNPWYEKMSLPLDELNIMTDKGIKTITHIFFVKLDTLIDGGSITFFDKNTSDVKNNWFKHRMQIHQNIGGTIRGTDLIPIGNSGNLLPIVIPSLDEDVFSLKRIDFINDLFRLCDIYQLRGQLDYITQHIHDILDIKN
jgi:hypothetical protein